jgi:NTP pyrophosphatase (non-canonical NTP hydrolase)
MKSFAELEQLVIKWGIDRGLYDVVNGSDATRQMKKLAEEYCELGEALAKGDRAKALDGVGDMLVVITHIARFLSSDLSYCYELAYLEIKDRKGQMVNGIFVKES